MNWKSILPSEIDINKLTLNECRNFNNFHELWREIHDVGGPKGFQFFYQHMHYLLFYATACIEEGKFPSLNKCWDKLAPLFLTKEYDCEWLVYCWMFCDFPLSAKSDEVLLDSFSSFIAENNDPLDPLYESIQQFCSILKSSRLGLYQETLSSSKITKYRELFTNNSISTVRSVPYYESGEIFLTRLVTFSGDTFAIHDSKSFPAEYKNTLKDMVRNKFYFLSESEDETINYQLFMKLAGPYWMSCTHADPSIHILNPDEYKVFYKNI